MAFLFVLVTIRVILLDLLVFWKDPEIQYGKTIWPLFRNEYAIITSRHSSTYGVIDMFRCGYYVFTVREFERSVDIPNLMINSVEVKNKSLSTTPTPHPSPTPGHYKILSPCPILSPKFSHRDNIDFEPRISPAFGQWLSPGGTLG